MSQVNAKFFTVVACMILGIFGRTSWLTARAYQTNARCSPVGAEDWSWMNNQNGSSPCLTAAAVSQPCFSNDFNVQFLVPGVGYTAPNVSANTANKCYCSWAAYNLLQACTVCQGQTGSVITWSLWTQSCGENLTTGRAYPPGFSIPNNLTFPNWAATDPTTWEAQRFNFQEAQQIEGSKPGDLQDPSALLSTPTPTPRNGNNVGAIAGGVVGGVLVLAIGIAAAMLLHCRSQRRKAQQAQQAPQMSQAPLDHHARNPSDTSAKTFRTGFGYSRLGHSSSPSNGSDSRILSSPSTFRTHNTSHNSLTYESLMGSISYPGTPSPQPSHQPGNHLQPHIVMTAHGAVIPFTLERPSPSQDTSSGHEKKRSDGSSTTGAAHRGPMNPPAYSAAPHGHGDFGSIVPDQASTYGGSASIITTPPGGNSSRATHERGPSVGTIGSNASTTSAGLWTHTGTASLSGAADLISQMGSGNVPGPSEVTPAYTGPNSSTNVPRDEKRA